MDDHMIDSMIYDHFDGENQMKRDEALYLKKKLMELNDSDFLEVLLLNTVNLYETPRMSLNRVVPKFPAGDIATKYRNSKQPLSDKQKEALANVYVYSHLGVRLRGSK